MRFLHNLYILNARIVLPNSLLDQGFIHIQDEKINTIGKMEDCPLIGSADQVIDCHGTGDAIPGMIDIHVHGAAGYDFMDTDEVAYKEIAQAFAKEGVTSFLATTITNPLDYTRETLKRLGDYHVRENVPGRAEMLGIHLEGPFINKEQKGAQPENAIVVPDANLFKEWQEVAGNAIKICTFAPELDVTKEFLEELKKTDVLSSMGHTNATYDESIDAIANGVTHATHLFNGMKGMHHRDPGVVGAALLQDDVHVEIIPDDIHFHKDLLKLIYKMKGVERILVITDGMRAKGMPDGTYDLGGQEVHVGEGRCVLASNGSLAGSIVTMNQARLNVAKWLDLSIHEQVQITSTNQASRLGMLDRKGTLAIGKDADIVILDSDGEVELTICRGTIAYERITACN